MNDRLERALAALAPHLLTIDPLGVLAILDDLEDSSYVAGYEAGLADACGVADAAEAWGVTPQRARAHIKRLGIGRQFGGSWRLTRKEIEENKPNAKYRIKS